MPTNQSMTLSPPPSEASALSPGWQAWLIVAVLAPMAVWYPAIKGDLAFAPLLRFAGARTLLGGLALLLLLVLRREADHLSLSLFLVPVFWLLIVMTGFGECMNAWLAGGEALILFAVAVSAFGCWSGTATQSNLTDGKPPKVAS